MCYPVKREHTFRYFSHFKTFLLWATAMWVVCKNYTVPFFYLQTDACLLATSVKLATLVCWFRCKFLSGVVFPSSSLFFQPAGWWCLPLACKKKKKKSFAALADWAWWWLFKLVNVWARLSLLLWLNSTCCCPWQEACLVIASAGKVSIDGGYQTVSIPPTDIQALGTGMVCILSPLERFKRKRAGSAEFKVTKWFQF